MRIVLDVLDDVRRNYPIDPDRTYVSGFSGGGRIACHLAFALPELFGGLAPVCRRGIPARGTLAPLPRRRTPQCGPRDGGKGLQPRRAGAAARPFLKDVGVRTRVWTVAGMGHGVPAANTLGEVVRWLEDALPKRQALAKKYPASRLLASDSSEKRWRRRSWPRAASA